MAKHIVHCRICHKEIDINSEDNWIKSGERSYYHKDCYNDWKSPLTTKADNEWVSLIYDFLSKDLKVPYNYHIVNKQIEKYQKENKYTVKGIYFALKYYYEIKKMPWATDKGHGGIGIVPYIYQESATYWTDQEYRKRGFIEALEQQIKERSEREVIKIKKVEKKKKDSGINWDDIGGEE